LIEEDEYKLQCTGIDKRVFEDFETSLVEYLNFEFEEIPAKLKAALKEACEDIDRLKNGQNQNLNSNSSCLLHEIFFIKCLCLYSLVSNL